jgi:RNA polymerase sigma factor (TIGR02999 family)
VKGRRSAARNATDATGLLVLGLSRDRRLEVRVAAKGRAPCRGDACREAAAAADDGWSRAPELPPTCAAAEVAFRPVVSPDPLRREEDLFATLYPELRRLAAAHLRGRSPTLQPTAVVHEAWLRMSRGEPQLYRDRTHFLAAAAVAIRHLLVDHDRRRRRRKRAGNARLSPLVEGDVAAAPGAAIDLLDLEAALAELGQLDARKVRVVELRVFGGATIDETAAILGVSHMTVSTDWQMARAWLIARLRG